jgi:hypothetical protein
MMSLGAAKGGLAIYDLEPIRLNYLKSCRSQRRTDARAAGGGGR